SKPNRAAAGQNIFDSSTTTPSTALFQTNKKNTQNRPHFSTNIPATRISKTEQAAYSALLSNSEMATVLPQEDGALLERKTPSILKALALVENKALLLQQQQQFYLLSLQQLQRLKIELSLQRDPVLQQPLLIPIVFD
ncbi:DNA mismatch repair protein, partial [Pasteurella multocida subsp. multocida str. Anand1_buffalo]